MLTLARRLSLAAAVGMLIVLLMGATVTKTGSGMGCGRSWPLCKGQFIPSYAFETLVEYSHRLVTSIEGFLLIGACIAAFRFRKQLPELNVLIPVTILTLILQSGMGAAAVMWPQSAPVLASHFGISLTALASTALMAFVLKEGPDRPARDDDAVPAKYRWWSFLVLVAMIVIAYLGAFVRHTKSSLACTTWPLCNGKVFTGLTWNETIVVVHRIVALLGVILIVWMWQRSKAIAARPDLARIGGIAAALIVIQALTGAMLPLMRLSFASTMIHAMLMSILFVVCAEWCRLALPRPKLKTASQPRMATGAGTVAPAAD
ncbi:MAG: COX15/CtaA family protein [Thermomicrobiales bacterium]